jgi:23S rRNA pseudouridine1911/1915/1917 synthase
LHAKSLGFIHPSTGKRIFFDSDYPDDLKAVIEKWKAYSIHKVLDED